MLAAASHACLCHSSLSAEAWLALPLAETISSATILRHACTWPAGEHIEVRSCRDCGRRIARKVRCAV